MHGDLVKPARSKPLLALGAGVLFLSSVACAAVSPAPLNNPFSGSLLVSALLYASDAQLVESVQPLEQGRAKVAQLAPVSFIWRAGPRKGQPDIGLIAQEVEQIVPEVVHTDANGMKSIDYPKLVPILVKAIQDNQAEIDALEAAVAERRQAIEALQARMTGI